MTTKEIGTMIKSLREGKEVICPECKKGKITTPYDSRTSIFFECTNCDFKIHMYPVENK